MTSDRLPVAGRRPQRLDARDGRAAAHRISRAGRATALALATLAATPSLHAHGLDRFLRTHFGMEPEQASELFERAVLPHLTAAGADQAAKQVRAGARVVTLASRSRVGVERTQDTVTEAAAETLKVLAAVGSVLPVNPAQTYVKAGSNSVGYAAAKRAASPRLYVYTHGAFDAHGLPTARGILRAVYAAYRSVELETDTTQSKLASSVDRRPNARHPLYRPTTIFQRAGVALNLRVDEQDALARLHAAQYGHQLLRKAPTDAARREITAAIDEITNGNHFNGRTRRLTRELYRQLRDAFADPQVARARHDEFRALRRQTYDKILAARATATDATASLAERVDAFRAAGSAAVRGTLPFSAATVSAYDVARAARHTSLGQRIQRGLARLRGLRSTTPRADAAGRAPPPTTGRHRAGR